MAEFWQTTVNAGTTEQPSLADVKAWIRGGGAGGLIPTRPSGDLEVSWVKFVVTYKLEINGQPPVTYATFAELQAAMRAALEGVVGNTSGGLTLSWSEDVQAVPEG